MHSNRSQGRRSVGGSRGGQYQEIEVHAMHHQYAEDAYPNEFTFVSSYVKYMIFVLNFYFWLLGGIILGIGIYGFMDKWQDSNGFVKLDTIYDVILNISLVMIIAGIVMFLISFGGCLGALRENTCLLKFYSRSLLIFFILEIIIATICFVFPQDMNSIIEGQFTDQIIHSYRDDPDLQNFIDFTQQEFQCCGLSNEGYLDWGKNEYFNCSSPAVENCGVPYSCCINATDIMCGYEVQKNSMVDVSKLIWTSGCIQIISIWAEHNMYIIASIALGVALSQLLVMQLADKLQAQIELQKSLWAS